MDGAGVTDHPDRRRPSVSDDVVSQELPDGAPPLARLRRWLEATLATLPEDFVGDVLLVCTELVSNAYEHARGPRGVRVAVGRGGCVVRVEVDDGSPQAPLVPGTSSAGVFRGRGLMFVERIATRWGVFIGDKHKTVWAEFSLGTMATST
ncbi:ATPase [Lentzea flava]|uniref:ATPase n=1 Tax=Lentzea flava TaxID=103732 RepID=A0ABQ2ULH2_9PSEU|nr:ATPase [Lentzea flava]